MGDLYQFELYINVKMPLELEVVITLYYFLTSEKD